MLPILENAIVNLGSTTSNGPELLTVKEAASLLRMNATYLASQLAAGEYPVEVAFRVGRRSWRLDRARLLEWCQKREQLRRSVGSKKAATATPSPANTTNRKRRRRA